jgi:PKD domain/Proprotein convertase P-domain
LTNQLLNSYDLSKICESINHHFKSSLIAVRSIESSLNHQINSMKYIFLPILAFFTTLTFAQSYEIDAVNGQTINTCTGTFYDSGGNTQNYAAGENYTVTFCSSTPSSAIQLSFSVFNIPGTSQLCFFDGPTVGAPSIGCFNSNTPITTVITSSAANLSRCVTVNFTSTSAGLGWAAVINCDAPCQTILPFLPTASSMGDVYSPVPPYIDICPGESINFTGSATYPQNNLLYAQSNATSTFVWDFGDGSVSTGSNLNVSHTYPNIGGYRVVLKVTDQNGCVGTYLQKVRVSTSPVVVQPAVDTICLGETATFNGSSFFNSSTSSIFPQGTFGGPLFASDSLFLPDRTGATFSTYSTGISVNSFPFGSTINSPTDLQSICMTMEHSFLGDLEIILTCPNGTSVVLKENPGGGGTVLGQPVDNDGTPNIQGTLYNYCFTNLSPTFGTMVFEAPTAPGVNYTNTAGNPESHLILPAGSYTPFQPFTNFNGCPINGAWTLTFRDHLGSDNGYLGNWSLNINPALLPAVETYTPTITSQGWVANPDIISGAGTTTAQIRPTTGGLHTYTYSVISVVHIHKRLIYL